MVEGMGTAGKIPLGRKYICFDIYLCFLVGSSALLVDGNERVEIRLGMFDTRDVDNLTNDVNGYSEQMR